jgi:molybdopterin molybdotransferase
MAQLSDDCFAPGEGLLPAETALQTLQDRLETVVETEILSLQDAAGRILARDVISERDVPPHDNSAVDGYAVYYNDLADNEDTELPVIGRAAAGQPLGGVMNSGTALRIFTGAPIPGGADGPDTIYMQEDSRTRTEGDTTFVILPPGISRGANRRSRGEDVPAGETVLRRGDRLRPQDIGLAASLGLCELHVFAPLTVGVLSTGDEVFEPGASMPEGGIYDANRHALIAVLSDMGCTVKDLGIIPDQPAKIARALKSAADTCDAVISTAGMSVGEEDHLAATVREMGSLYFWKVAIKPGRPIAFGQIGQTPFIGLPGNPAAMMVTFLRMARPALLRLAGLRDARPRLYPVRAGFAHRKKENRREYVRVHLEDGADGIPVARKYPRSGAGILSSLVGSDGLVELPEEMTQLSEGTMVSFLPFTEVAR